MSGAQRTRRPSTRIQLSPKQANICAWGWQKDARFRYAVCGRRFGKTTRFSGATAMAPDRQRGGPPIPAVVTLVVRGISAGNQLPAMLT